MIKLRSVPSRFLFVLVFLVLLIFSTTSQRLLAVGTIVENFAGLNRTVINPLTEVPDVDGAVGLNHYIQVVNQEINAYQIRPTFSSIPVGNNTLNGFFSFGTGVCTDPAITIHQPQVLYDHMSQRWMITAVAYYDTDIDDGPYYQCLAYSDFDTPLSTWTMYTFTISNDYLHDLPKFGLWPDGIYMAANQYDIWNNGLNRTPSGVTVWAFNRDDLVAGNPTPDTQNFYLTESSGYTHLLPSNLLGTPPPANTPNYFAAIQPPNRFLTWEFDVDWSNPSNSSFSGPKVTTVNNFTPRVGFLATQSGSPERLDLVAPQLMPPLQYRYETDNGVAPALWANHTIADGSTTGIRWYEMRNLNAASHIVYQQGTVATTDDSLTPQPAYLWLGSLAVDGQGNMALAYSKSNGNMFPSIYQTGRFDTDPLGQLQPEVPLFDGTAPQDTGNVDGRWGHQSNMSLDPYDQCNFWYTNQYYDAAFPGNVWQTRIINFSLEDCGAITTGTISRVSLHTNNTQAAGGGSGIHSTDISGDGRFVAFDSESNNLVNGDTNGSFDVFVRDRDTDEDGIFDEPGAVTTERVSVSSAGDQGNADSGMGVTGDFGGTNLSISANGRFVAFASDASNLVSGDTNGTTDVFVHDRDTGTTVRVSIDSGGNQGGAVSDQPSLSGNGRYVVFRSFANNLVANDTNVSSDIFIHDRDTDADGNFDEPGSMATWRVSVSTVFLVQGNGDSFTPAISPDDDGRYITFASDATNLTGTDTNGVTDVFVYDRDTDNNGVMDEPFTVVTSLVSANLVGTDSGNGRSYNPAVSEDGLITFGSLATDLVLGPINGFSQIYTRDAVAGGTTLISVDLFGTLGNRDSYRPAISPDGAFVALESDSSNFIPGDMNGLRDIYVVELATGEITRSSFGYDGSEPNGDSYWPAISNGGTDVSFASNATNLVIDDTNNLRDVFAHGRYRTPPPGPQLRIPQESIPAVYAGESVEVPVEFTSNGNAINSIAFALDLSSSCWLFDDTDADNNGIPDSVTFTLPPTYYATAIYNSTDAQLDITVYRIPPAVIPDGNFVTVALTAVCQPPPAGSLFATVSFSDNPVATFGNVDGQNVAGTTQDGSIEILYNNVGDCNGDLAVNAADISALILEIYDNDGNAADDVPGGSFAGNPRGCDSNQDGVVDSGDITCTILIIFDGFAACSTISTLVVSTNSAPVLAVQSSQIADPVQLWIDQHSALPDEPVSVPVRFKTNDNEISSMVFSIDYDQSLLTFDPTDANSDGIPDAVQLNVPAAFVSSVSFDAADTDGEIDVVIYDLSLPFATLSTDDLMSITFTTANTTDTEIATVHFSQHPSASFGDPLGQSVAGNITNGSVRISLLNEHIFMPFFITND